MSIETDTRVSNRLHISIEVKQLLLDLASHVQGDDN